MRKNITQIHPCAKASWLSLYEDCKLIKESYEQNRISKRNFQ